MRKFFTSESVTEGHPDKMADQISDAVLDELIRQDPSSRVACETILPNGFCLVAGEITTRAYADIPGIVRQVIKDIGYTRAEYGFHFETSGVAVAIKEQSSDIAGAVASSTGAKKNLTKKDFEKLGAGDQGMMFGYACTETPELMPWPIVLSHRVCRQLAQARKTGQIKGIRPDGKSQVTVEYENDQAIRVEKVLVSSQHDPDLTQSKIKTEIIERVIKPAIPKNLLDKKTQFIVNPSGRFVIGGPQGDCGLTGRKIIVDTYGGYARHGGGCFSGKDPTKVDRSGAYGARYVAKNVVAAGLAERCEVQVSYSIGLADPQSVRVDTFGTGKVDDARIARAIHRVFDLRPGMLIYNLKLQRPIYRQVASYGHFGRPDLNLPWEKTDMITKLKKSVR